MIAASGLMPQKEANYISNPHSPMFSHLRPLVYGLALALSVGSPVHAQKLDPAPQSQTAETEESSPFQKLLESIEWKKEGSGALGNIATIDVPNGYAFTGAAGTIKLMEAYGNLTSGTELGYITPVNMDWFAVFEFEDIGYVKDDEKDNLDSGKILEQMKEGQEAANTELSKRGMPTLSVIGWHTLPFYNPETNNLEWAIRLRSSDGSEVLNYKTKLLGRRGVMDVVLVCGEEQMKTLIPEYQKLLKGFSFKKEESYAAFTKGDKIAEYGLTGLILGGGLLAAAKSGLLTKLWKPILVGILAIGAFLKRIFVGKTKESL